MARGWDNFLTARDHEVFARAGYGERAGFGERPGLLIVDVNKGFCGDKPEPILQSIETWRNSCGSEAWDALPHIANLLQVARERGVPVIYTTSATLRSDGWDQGRWSDKNRRRQEDRRPHPNATEIMPQIAPHRTDIVIPKYKPSAFHGTMLASYLVDLEVDSLIIAGTTTSGCVRATVLDAFSLNYRVTVVEEATFDRGQASHWISLFDMNQKYADIVGVDEVAHFLGSLPASLFEGKAPADRACAQRV